jgi:16S rRNA (guanine966-N2)-methyltransferase
MRVITGTAKGRRLKAPEGLGTRPMLDRVKEALFSVLEGYGPIRGRVLDLYAGTGALGIECLSRGASWADFVEHKAHVCRIIRENLEHTRLADRARVFHMPVERFLRQQGLHEKYDIIIMDPPYADPAIEATICAVHDADLLKDTGLLVVGHSPRVELDDRYQCFHRRKFRRLGDSCFSIYDLATDDAADGSGETHDQSVLPSTDG